MNYHSHRIAGFCLGLTSGILLTNGKTDVSSLCLVALSTANGTISAVIPDIDHPNSYIGKKHKVTSFITNKTMGHRGAMHSPFILLILSVLFLVLFNYIPKDIWNYQNNILKISNILTILLTSFVAGYFSHLLMDSLTVGGIPWLYPFSKKCYSIAHLKTNKNEIIAQILFIIPTIIFVLTKYELFKLFI